ncbi:hypothetical protein EST38_g8002 [Candolleomyces aberdarensis]|uniref:Uncharacterized protein n=1 Tax=Candolleomyces aberdarensis TaxID=2316362 RepID=A0A4V1Q3A0_9AGAR|nr:hypothetical protein EST38_g8002 [Candolleomyces aberdarensis]
MASESVVSKKFWLDLIAIENLGVEPMTSGNSIRGRAQNAGLTPSKTTDYTSTYMRAGKERTEAQAKDETYDYYVLLRFMSLSKVMLTIERGTSVIDVAYDPVYKHRVRNFGISVYLLDVWWIGYPNAFQGWERGTSESVQLNFMQGLRGRIRRS